MSPQPTPPPHQHGLNCRETFRKLDDYVDRELSPDEQQAVAEHLEECARCAQEFAVERDMLDALKNKLRRIAAPQGLMETIAARLRQAER